MFKFLGSTSLFAVFASRTDQRIIIVDLWLSRNYIADNSVMNGPWINLVSLLRAGSAQPDDEIFNSIIVDVLEDFEPLDVLPGSVLEWIKEGGRNVELTRGWPLTNNRALSG